MNEKEKRVQNWLDKMSSFSYNILWFLDIGIILFLILIYRYYKNIFFYCLIVALLIEAIVVYRIKKRNALYQELVDIILSDKEQ